MPNQSSAMHRATPMGRSMQQWRKTQQELHRARLKSIKPSIDNQEPRVFTHLHTKKKREQLLLDRYSQIEKENRILLEKMAEIMGRPTFQPKPNVVQLRSLNAEARRRRLKRITEENQQILKRIQTAGPNYDHRVWDQHWETHQSYLKNLCEYPCILLDGKETHQRARHAPELQLDRPGPNARAARPAPPHTAPPASYKSSLPALHPGPVSVSSSPALHGARRVRRTRRRKSVKKHGVVVVDDDGPGAAMATGPSRILLREGKNIDGTYVIVSVIEFNHQNASASTKQRAASASSKKPSQQHVWQFKVYDPQFSDEVAIVVPFDVIVEVIARDRPELIAESRRGELAALAIGQVRVDSSSGRLQAAFGSSSVEGVAAVDGSRAEYEDDEFGAESDLVPPRPPQPLFGRPSLDSEGPGVAPAEGKPAGEPSADPVPTASA